MVYVLFIAKVLFMIYGKSYYTSFLAAYMINTSVQSIKKKINQTGGCFT